MTISVIIPLYNKSATIKETLQSVLLQTFADFEVIVVNDGSTDSSLEIVTSFDDNRIKIFSQENKGVSAARNHGIKKATSNLIAFIDADDFWFPNHLEEILKLTIDFTTCGMFCSRYAIKTAHKNIENISYSISDNFRGIVPDFFESSIKNRIALTSALAIKKEILENVGYFNENYTITEDLDLWIKIALKYQVAITDNTTCIYNFNNNNISKTSILKQKLPDFKEFESFEKDNISLKKFLDLYRIEYALKYRTAGDFEKSNFYLESVNKKSISSKTTILLQISPSILQFLLKMKHISRKMGFNFNAYR